MSPFSPWSSWTGASDASAEKAGDSWIGGWLTNSPEPSSGSSTRFAKNNILGLSNRMTLRRESRPWSSTAPCFWHCCWWRRILQHPVDFTSHWWVTIKAMYTPFSTMLPERCPLLWFWWSSSTNFTKLGICWLLPIHVEMTINGLMSWRILSLKALILLWEWILRPIFRNLLWFQKFWKLAILHCGKTTWTPTCDLFGEGWVLDPEHVRPLPAAAGGAVMGGEDTEWSVSF